MKIIIEDVPQKHQRYETLGDYWVDPDGTKRIVVSRMKDRRYALLIALHEFIEQELCLDRGIPETEISGFDIAHPELDDPGNSQAAPYHKEHVFAECLERLFARELGVNWQKYEQDCLDHFKE